MFYIYNMKQTLACVLLITSTISNAQNHKQGDTDSFEVYTWYNPQAARYELVSVLGKRDSELEIMGWEKISFAFVGFKEPSQDRVMLSSWVRSTDNDFLIINESEYSDEQMKSMGYSGKRELFYIRRKKIN